MAPKVPYKRARPARTPLVVAASRPPSQVLTRALLLPLLPLLLVSAAPSVALLVPVRSLANKNKNTDESESRNRNRNRNKGPTTWTAARL